MLIIFDGCHVGGILESSTGGISILNSILLGSVWTYCMDFISIENIVIVSANVQQPTEAPFLTACKQEINQPSLTEILVCLKMNSSSFYSAACKCKCLVYLSPGLGMVRSLSLCVMFWDIFVLFFY